jgi:pilus assembly protein CpaE
MQSVLRMVLVDPCTDSREELKRMLADMDPVWVEAEFPRYDQYPDVLNETQPDIVVIGSDADPGQALQMVAETLRRSPKTRIFVTSSLSDSERILRAMRCGAHEYLTTPVQMEELLPALDRVRQARAASGERSTGSIVVSVAGSQGGVGVTSIAVNLACALAAEPERRVVLVDLDMVLGDADVWLDIVHNYTLLDVVENINRLDFSLLKRSLVRHSSGLSFLTHPSGLDEIARVRGDSLKRLIGLLKATFTHVVLDLSKGFHETDVAAMEASDSVLIVGQLNVSCLRNLTRLFKTLETMSGLVDRTRVVINRVGTREQNIPVEKAEETIGRKVFWQIPNDWSNMFAARDAGAPIVLHAPRSKVSQAITALAGELAGNPADTHRNGSVKKRGLFSLLR